MLQLRAQFSCRDKRRFRNVNDTTLSDWSDDIAELGIGHGLQFVVKEWVGVHFGQKVLKSQQQFINR
jgi:hypothetical protein